MFYRRRSSLVMPRTSPGFFFSRSEARRIFHLAAPVFFAQLSQMLMGVVDTVMTGHYRTTDMAAVAVAASIWVPVSLFGIGVMLALTPLIAQRLGAGDRKSVPHLLRQGVMLALALSVPLIATLLFFARNIHWFGLEHELARIAAGFLRAIACGLPGFLLFIAVRGLLDGDARTRPAMLISFCGLLLNIPCNYLLIYGRCGLPELGGIGSGVSTAIAHWFMGAALVCYTRGSASYKDLRPLYAPLWRGLPGAPRLDLCLMARILRIGVPGALSLLFEVTCFTICPLLLAPLGTTVVAGHQVAMSVTNLLFMIPLSLCITSTIRVGRCLGEGNPVAGQTVSWTALGSGFVMACATCTGIILLRYEITGLYTNDPQVRELAATLLLYTAAFQLVDAVQIICLGSLRGYNDTLFISMASFGGYCCLGLPLGIVLARTDLLAPQMGAAGFWAAFVICLSSLALVFLWRLRRLHRLGP
ncbi:MAG: MATE family efflux transporter, partial [Betaproteobacteria bacterium]|nr:MATE family efflux transporter [Betaproteobacteria bacterium]